MLVVTWNIKFGRRAEQAAADLAAAFDHIDLLLLQEMDRIGTDAIAESLGMYSAYGALAEHKLTGREFGNAILATTPIDHAEMWRLPHSARWRGHPRHALAANITLGGRSTLVASVHTEVPWLGPRRRRAQYGALAERLSGSANPALIGGDFNTFTARSRRTLSDELAAVDVELAELGSSTLRWWRLGWQLDHLAVRGWTVENSGVLTNSEASDHDAVWIWLVPKSVRQIGSW